MKDTTHLSATLRVPDISGDVVDIPGKLIDGSAWMENQKSERKEKQVKKLSNIKKKFRDALFDWGPPIISGIAGGAMGTLLFRMIVRGW